MKKITPFLWLDTNVQEAADFYLSIFKNGKRVGSTPGPGGSLMSVTLDLEGQELILFNGGPMFKLNEAFSLTVRCDSQEEIDYYWEKLTGSGGAESRCGWLKDKHGLSWQVIPPALIEMLTHSDREKANRAMQSMMTMNKINIAEMQKAFNGE